MEPYNSIQLKGDHSSFSSRTTQMCLSLCPTNKWQDRHMLKLGQCRHFNLAPTIASSQWSQSSGSPSHSSWWQGSRTLPSDISILVTHDHFIVYGNKLSFVPFAGAFSREGGTETLALYLGAAPQLNGEPQPFCVPSPHTMWSHPDTWEKNVLFE